MSNIKKIITEEIENMDSELSLNEKVTLPLKRVGLSTYEARTNDILITVAENDLKRGQWEGTIERILGQRWNPVLKEYYEHVEPIEGIEPFYDTSKNMVVQQIINFLSNE